MLELGLGMRQRQRHRDATGPPDAPGDGYPGEARLDEVGDAGSVQVVAAVEGRIPILIDSGFRRGTDVFKALALGASAVCIGRPYLWGLAAFGQDGVEAVLAILRRELETIMTEMGTPNLAVIMPAHVADSHFKRRFLHRL